MTTDRQIIEKLKELVDLLKLRISHYAAGNLRGHNEIILKIEKRESEISALESQISEEESYPREFVEWVGVQELFFDHDNLWIFETDEYGVVWKKTTTELFEYWQSKVKNEKR